MISIGANLVHADHGVADAKVAHKVVVQAAAHKAEVLPRQHQLQEQASAAAAVLGMERS